jgi:hypothetical protein
MTYHERVAHTMVATWVVGSMNTYETVLARLYERCPTEAELRAMIAGMEERARKEYGAPDNFRLVPDE